LPPERCFTGVSPAILPGKPTGMSVALPPKQTKHSRRSESSLVEVGRMKTNRILLSLALVAAFGFAGCKKKEAEPDASEATPAVTESEVPGAASQSDLSPATAESRVDDVTTGHALAADGSIDASQVGTISPP